MRTIHLYIVKQVLKNLVMTIFVLTMLFLIGNALKDILKLISSYNVPLLTVGEALAYLLPFVMVYTLPIAFMTATILVFGRLSADQELTAMRASGIALTSILYPVIVMSLVFCFLCLWVNLDLGPRGRVAFKKLQFEVGQQELSGIIPVGRFITDLPDYVLYVGEMSDGDLKNVLFYQLKNGRKVLDIRSPSAQIINDPSSDQFVLRFVNPTIFFREGNDVILFGGAATPEVNEASPTSDETDSLFSDWQPFYTPEFEYSVPRPHTDTFRKVKLSEMTYAQLIDEYQTLKDQGMDEDDLMPVKMQMHEKMSFSFASFGFTLLGIPLGIQAHRKDTSSGVAIALVLMLVYYGMVIGVKSIASQPSLNPHILLWVPNILFQALGAFLIYKKNKV